MFVGDTVLQREETCCYSDIVTSVIRALRNKNKKTHRNSCSAQRKPEGKGKKNKPRSQGGIYPLFLFHVFQPRPLSPHPRNRECERGGGTWVIAEEGSTIWDTQPTLRGQFYLLNPGKDGTPPKKIRNSS